MSLYDDVADTLPADIVEAIEVSLPCVDGSDHLWEFEEIESLTLWSRPIRVRVDRYWHCACCHIITFDNPHP